MKFRVLAVVCLIMLTCAVGVGVAKADAFPGTYVSGSFAFGSISCPDLSITNSSSGNCATGVLHQSSYSFNYSGTDPFGTAKIMDAIVQPGSMHLLEQVTRTTLGGSSTDRGALEYGDSLTVMSNTLADGSPVQLQFTANMRYAITGPAGTAVDPTTNALLTMGLYFQGSPFYSDPSSFGSGIGFEPPACTTGTAGTSGTLTCTFVENLLVGQSTWFVQRLEGFDGIGVIGTETIDASDTAWLTIQSLDPNATFTTGSGYSYVGDPDATPSAVPEPSSLLLVASGLGGWLGILRKTRQA